MDAMRLNVARTFSQQRRSWILAEMAAALLVIGLADFLSSYQFRLLPLYAGPIFVVAWFFGWKPGLAAALISAVIWWVANWFNGDPDLRSWFRLWEVCRHVGFFLVVGWTGAALRAKNDMATARIALLEHSQRLEQQIVDISEAEQRRIGQDLHDGVCQVLAALSCAATSLRTELEKRELKTEASSAGELARLLQNAVVETRDLARSLVPAHVSDVGLAVALEALTQSVSRMHRVNCAFRLHGNDPHENGQVATHLYRIAQEAINNALNHGRAKNISLSLGGSNGHIDLAVTDDGVGIPLDPRAGGMGLAVMGYRARLSGGELTVNRMPGGGTKVSCTVAAERPRHESVAA
jgi:signal transduction histidine kinase